MLYWLKLILNYDQGPALFRQKQILTTSHKKFTKTEQWRFLYSITLCLATFNTNNNYPMSIKEILDQRIFLNLHSFRLSLMSDNLYFYNIPTRNILDKFTIIRDHLCRFLQPGLISSTIFLKKLDLPTANHKRYINVLWA